MKKTAVLIFFTLISFYSFGKRIHTGADENSVRIVQSTDQEIILEMSIASFELLPVMIQGELYYKPVLDNEPNLYEKGSPDLPFLARGIIISGHLKPVVEVIHADYEAYQMKVAPSKGMISRDQDPALIPYEFGRAYEADEYYPRIQADLAEPYIFRDFRGTNVMIRPFTYNHIQGILKVCTRMTVRISYAGEDDRNVLTVGRNTMNTFFKPLYERHFLNFAHTSGRLVGDVGRMIVICADALATEAMNYVIWKNKKGIPADLVPISSIGNNSTAILNYIQGQYNYGLAFVQIVGDAEQVATMIHNTGESDPSYALLAGSDSYPDIIVGRFSASTVTELETQIDRTIYYERDLNSGEWLHKGTGIASDEGAGIGWNGLKDRDHMDVMRTRLLSFNYTLIDQIYDPGATAAAVTTALNQGRGILNYCGHGSTGGWATSGFGITQVNALVNDNMLPFIHSVACVNGNFGGSTCFAEAWLRATNGTTGAPTGAIAMYASSINQSWAPPMSAQDFTIQHLVEEDYYSIGALWYNGSCGMIDEFGNDGADMFKTWHIFGDASLSYRTDTPQSMSVSHADEGYPGEPFTVSAGFQGAFVSISFDGDCYISGFTGVSGTYTFIVPENLGITTMDITVSAYNRITYTGQAEIYFEFSWTGEFSSDWFDYRNWSGGEVPGSYDTAYIIGNRAHYPVLNNGTPHCMSLIISSGGQLTVQSNQFEIYNDLSVYGQLILNGPNALVSVDDDVIWYSGSGFSSIGTGNIIYVEGDWTFDEGSTVNLTNAEIRFMGAASSIIICNSALSSFSNLTSNKIAPATVRFDTPSLSDLVVTGLLSVTSNSRFTQNSPKKLILTGNLDAQGDFFQQSGNFVCQIPGTLTFMKSTSYFDTLTISHSGTTSINTDIDVRGLLSLNSGTLSLDSYDLNLSGNLLKLNGQLSMTTGSLVFEQADEQFILSDIQITNVVLDKAADTLRIHIGKNVIFDHYDWNSGFIALQGSCSLTINDLLDDGITGGFKAKLNSTLNITNPTGSVDLNGKLIISGSAVNVYGGNHASYWPGSADAEIHMSSGTLDFKDRGIFILDHPSLDLLENITGGTIRTPGGFQGDRSGFNPTGGTIEIYGTSNGDVAHGSGSNFYKLIINRGASASQLNVMSNLDINNDLVITSGDLDINGFTVDIAGLLDITGKLTMTNSASVLNVGTIVAWKPGSESNVTAGLITFKNGWHFHDGTNAQLTGSNTAKALGTANTDIYHKDLNACFANFTSEKTSGSIYLDGSSQYPMRVTHNMTVKNNNNLHVNACTLLVDGTLELETNTTLMMMNGGVLTADTSIINNSINVPDGFAYSGNVMTINGAVNMLSGGALNFNEFNLNGLLDINAGSFLVHNNFTQAPGGTFTLDGGSFIIDKPYTGNFMSLSGTTNLNGGIFEISYEGIQFGTGATVNFNGGNLRIGGNFRAINASCFQPAAGAVELINNSATIECSNGNYFNRLIINKSASASCFLSTAISIHDDLEIQSGNLQTLNQLLTVNGDLQIETLGKLTAGTSQITVGGNWANNRGTTGFVEGTSSVWLESATPITLNSETFYNLDLAKSLAPGQYVQMQTGATVNVLNKLTLGAGGALMMNENAMLSVSGNLHIKSGGGLNANNGAPNTIILCGGHWWDYNTTTTADQGFSPGFSTVQFTGANSQELIVYQPGITFWNLSIQKSGNGLTPFDNVTVLNNFSLGSGTMRQSSENITFRFGGDFYASDPALWLDQANLVIFEGQAQQDVTTTTQGTLNFRAVQVNRPAGATESGNLNVMTDLQCVTDFDIVSGDVTIEGYRLILGGGIQVLAEGSLHMSQGSNLYLGPDASLFVNGGSFAMTGSSDNRSRISRSSTGYYEFLAENGGEVELAYTDVEYTDVNGLYIGAGGLIAGDNPLQSCAFGPGEASGVLITINNAQELTCNGLIFPENTWSGSRSISKTVNTGVINLPEATGAFAGPNFENDPYGRINWPSYGYWEGDVSSEWHDLNNWRYDIQVPDAGTDVVILPGKPNYPVLSQQAATVKTLKMGSNTSLSVLQNSLTVNEWADIRGQVVMADDAQDQIDIYVDSLVWQPGSSVNAMGKSTFWVTGDMFIRQGTSLNMTAGEFRFTGTEESRLICHDTATIFSLYNAKTPPASLSFVGDTLAQLTVNGNFQLGTNAILKCPSSQEWVFDGGVRNTSNGHFRCENGTIRLSGIINPNYFRLKQGDYFHNLVIDTLVNLYTTTGYSDTLRVMGDLVLAAGSGGSTTRLTANAFKILVWGDWINNLNNTAFTAGTSKVIFMDPSVPQNVEGYTIFNDLNAGAFENSTVNFYGINYVNNVMESYFTTNVYGTLYTNMVYSDNDFAALNIHDGGYMEIQTFHQGAPVTVTLGMIEIRDLAQDYITGNYTVNNGLISLGQTTGLNDSHDLYFANLTINEGYIWFIGGNRQSLWPRIPGSASVNMTNGTMDLMNQEVFITNGNFTENISGGKLKTVLGFGADPACTTFHPAGGTVELYGLEDCSFSLPAPACWFHNLHLSKTEGAGAYLSSDIRVKNEFRLNTGAYMETDGFLITVGP